MPTDDNVLVGFSTDDDAGVYLVEEGLALVQTVDFITPVVDDPLSFGRIAAANSLSDVFAMGGEVVTAMNLLCVPSCGIDPSVLALILKGGAEKIKEAGGALVGGHTVENPELVYGLSVTGRVDPRELTPNSGAKPGQKLVLTKPLGTGIISTAVKAAKATVEETEKLVSTMEALNRTAARLMREFGATGATDVTGFGLLGHGVEMARASGAALKIAADGVPLLPGTMKGYAKGMRPAGIKRNAEAFSGYMEVSATAEKSVPLFCDPQTSGGLLVALPAEAAEAYVGALAAEGVEDAAIIGEVSEGPPSIRFV